MGTEAGIERLAIAQEMGKLRSRQTALLVNRLENYREALGLPPLNEAQGFLANLFFSSASCLMDVETECGVFADFLALHPDAFADLKKALFEGITNTKIEEDKS